MLRGEYLKLAKSINKVCLSMNSRQNGIYSPKVDLHKDKSVKELTKDIEKMVRFLRAPYYSYMSKDK
jgi:hypothetical protein